MVVRPLSRNMMCLAACTLVQVGFAGGWQMKQAPLMTAWAALVNTNAPLPEYPRPQLVRSNWLNLNGIWQFQPGVTNTDPVPTNQTLTNEILVPYPMESAISGVMQYYAWSWYRRLFTLPTGWSGNRIILHLDAVDWQTTLYLNGTYVGAHKGGYDPFSFDITSYLNAGTNELILQVYSPEDNGGQPRGKQTIYPGGIMYTSSSGVWQPVWLEPVDASGVQSLRLIPDIDNARLRLTANTYASNGVTVYATALSNNVPVSYASGPADTELDLAITNAELWWPTNPFLYSLQITLTHNGITNDFVTSYFGMRKISVNPINGTSGIFLNNQLQFSMGPLDQGFWPDGIYTAPTDDALKYDLQQEIALGFNTVRKHIKVERQRWYYWADTLGLMVWQDMPSCNSYTGNPSPPAVDPAQFQAELTALVTNHWNSPAIVMWTIFNEGQGQAGSANGVGQASTASLVQLVQTLDPYRLVNQASGGSYFGVGNVFDNHNYPDPGNPTSATQAPVDGEFGGIEYQVPGHLWNPALADGGYIPASSEADIATNYAVLIDDVVEIKSEGTLNGAIYTQITDVENECNGLMTYDRLLKPEPAPIALANQYAITGRVPAFYWQGGTADFNVASNWSGGAVPGPGTNAINDSGSNNVAQINAWGPAWTVNDLRAGDNTNTTGAFAQNGSTVIVSGTLSLGEGPGAAGYYTLNEGTLDLNGGGFNVGGLGTGIVTINGGAITSNPVLDIGDPGTGMVTQTNGVVTINNQLWIANNPGATGTYALSGGSLTVSNWVAIGRGGGHGTFELTGGTCTMSGISGANFLLGTGYNAPAGSPSEGVLNQSGGVLNIVGGAQFLCPEESPATGTYNLSGSGQLNCNNWIAIGRGGAGVLNLSGGTISKNDGNGDHIDIGAGGSGGGGPGTIIQTGGLITNTTSDFWMAEAANATWNMSGGKAFLSNLVMGVNAGYNATLNLEGGTLSVARIYSPNPGSSLSVLNFNGGTLQASMSTTGFLSNLSAVYVLTNGAFINDGGNSITVSQPLLNGGGGGGLTKTGAGALFLNATNTYTGPTTIMGGTLGGTGSLAGPVSVRAGVTLAPGAPLGTLTISNALTLTSGSTGLFALSINGGKGLIRGLTTVSYAGTLVVTNVGSGPLANGSTFTLFSSASAGTGNFSQIVVLPAGSGTGSFNPATGVFTFLSPVPNFDGPRRLGTNLILTGTGGSSGAAYTVLTSTNLTVPFSNWTIDGTGVFNGSGMWSNVIPLNLSDRSRFFRLRSP